MRNIALFLFVTVFIFSCSSDDDNNEIETLDPIVGKWFFGNTVYKLTSGGDYIESISSCEAQTYYKFNANGTAEIMSYYDNSTECTLEESDLSQFTWVKVSANIYQLYSVENDGTESTRNESVYFETPETMYWVDVFNGQIEGNDFNERWSYFNK